MMDYLDVALKHGGFTSLDRTYLTQLLQGLSHDQKLAVITPPPSVINAYFAEHYQKGSPQAATDYLLELSTALDLFVTEPDFTEVKPFVRLNLSGRSFGFAFVNARGLAQVFPEDGLAVSQTEQCELAELFPHLVVYEDGGKVFLEDLVFEEDGAEELDSDGQLLIDLHRLADGTVRISGYNREDVMETASRFTGQIYLGFSQRKYTVHVTPFRK